MPLHTDNGKTEKITYTALMGTLAIVLGFAENTLLPALPFLPPGAKPGLSNIVTMFTACTCGLAETGYIILIKSLFVLFTRGMSAFGMSLAGGLFSGILMFILLKLKPENLSYIGISVLSATAHNAGKLAMSIVCTASPLLIHYLPALLISGVISGTITGIILQIILPKVLMGVTGDGSF